MEAFVNVFQEYFPVSALRTNVLTPGLFEATVLPYVIILEIIWFPLAEDS